MSRLKANGIRLTRLATMLAALCGQPSPAVSSTPLTLSDIIEAKTIDGLSTSPDGQWVAYRVISRSVQADRVAGRWYKVRIDGSGSPIALGMLFNPLTVMIMGFPRDGVSQWAPDSSALYVLAEANSEIQVHRLSEARDSQITHDEADVESFRLSPDGRDLAYQTRNSREAIALAQKSEDAQGIRLDRTVVTDGLRLTDNYRIGEKLTTIRRLNADDLAELGRGDVRTKHLSLQSTTQPSASKLTPARQPGTALRPQDAMSGEGRLPLEAKGISVILRQVVKGNVNGPMGRNRIEADLPDGKHVICSASFCEGSPGTIRLVAHIAGSDTVQIFSEPDYSRRTSIWTWAPATDKTALLRADTGALDDGSVAARPCQPIEHYVLCVESGPTRPPRLIRIDLRTGKDVILDDPNAILASKHFPKTRVVFWRDPDGRPWNGVLVLPDGAPRQRWPLVITSYYCRGFLRGGLAALTPEFLLAQEGIAALCMNANSDIFGQRDQAGNIAAMKPYKDMDASFAAIINQLALEGTIDPTRVGISGHSFSANAATYAISHTKLFRAAAIGSGVTIDPGTYPVLAPAGDSWRKGVYGVIGLPLPTDDPAHVWDQTSPALNARAITAPLLIQAPESEYLFALQQYAYMQDAHKQVEMFIYPGEGHVPNARPIHQFWRNRRAIDWFVKWLLPSPPPAH